MTRQATLSREVSESKQEQQIDRGTWNREVIFTVNGSAKAARKVWRTGTRIGIESANKRPPPEIPVEFVDWPFSKLDNIEPVELFEQHLQAVQELQPKFAVAPDIDGTFDRAQVINMADELARAAEIVIVVPKVVHPSEVPDRFRIGMPCQSRYGPAPWKWTAYQDVDSIHLLGGSPVIHQEVMKYYIPVESVDTSAPVRAAQFGSYWTGDHWREVDCDGAFYWCLEQSYANLRGTINPDREVWSPRSRNRRHDYEQWFVENHPDADLWGPDEVPPMPRYPTDESTPEWL
jgi:hypothetical protein